MALFNFFKPKWQHTNPAVRLKAVEGLTDSDLQILIQMASADTEPAVRQEALSRIDDWRLLTPLASQDIDAVIVNEVNRRVDTLQREAVHAAQGLDAKLIALASINKDELLAEIVLGEVDTEIRLAAMERIVNQAVLADLVTKNCGKGPALLAIDKIDDESLLRTAVKHASNRVARARAQGKVDEIEAARNLPDPETLRELELAHLLERVRHLTEAVDPESALTECRQLQRQWREIAGQDQRSAEFDHHCTLIRSRQQERAVQDELRKADETERGKRLERLPQILAEIEALNSTVSGEEESRLQSLQQEWANLLWNITPPLTDDTLLFRYDQALDHIAHRRILATQEQQQESDLLSALDTVATLIEKLELDQALTKLAAAQRTFDSWHPGCVSRQQVAERLCLLRDHHQAGYARREEMERLRLEANWQQRQQLLAIAKKLLADDDVRGIEQRLAEILTQWQQPVALPIGVADLEPEFAAVRAAITERLDVAQKEESWLRWQNKILKAQLIDEADALAFETDLHRVFKRIKELQEQWRTVGTAPAKEEPLLWRRFHEATERHFARCRAFFQQLDADAERNLEEKNVLRDQAIACQESNEWQKTAEFIKDLQVRWKTIGRGPQEREHEVYTDFRAACDHFFERRKGHHAELDQERQANLERKETLCQEAEALADQPETEHKGKFQELQLSWKAIGPVPRDQEEAIWQRFRAACDRFYDWLDTLRPENLARKEALCLEVDELTAQLGPDSNFIQIAKKIVALQRRWKEIGPVPKEAQNVVWHRFKGHCDAFFAAKADHDHAIDLQRPHYQKEKEALLARVRELSAAPTMTKETVQEIVGIQEAWRRVGLAEKDREQVLQRDFRAACDAFFKERREAFQVIEQLHRENLKKKEALCLRLEILAGVTPQPVAQIQGKQGRMTLAEQLKIAFETNFVISADDPQSRNRRTKDEITAVNQQWQLIGPVPREHDHAIRRRFNEALIAAAKM